MKELIESLKPKELFDLGWFFKQAILNAQAHSGIPEREFRRCLVATTGNRKIDKILKHISGNIKLGNRNFITHSKLDLYKLLESQQ